ncbi:AAA family ATPase [Mycolicibacterium flavescens]|uniref:Nuclease SbcCD subunit C n=1 Tax=Mycolicibacterium flavescens TaxID=1776 RepID=A0A1E3RNA9_MYCFV|nr:ATP-binding protein [Mycolicibacterium flavescens]MCV7281686.1 AAA family ATPase [Mycolicibacterium flavescens]ODQ90912.1 recombinase RecF [Mycolicibacterium flavescens]
MTSTTTDEAGAVSDARLKNYVLARADDDPDLSEEARLVVLAALEGSSDLSEVLGDQTTRTELVESLTTPAATTTEPTGAYLTSITVEGFRGIGPEVTLPLKPGPGLTVVAGRNGSGKSTLAEGLELALTGTNSRWKNKPAIWSQDWRNLHAGQTSRIRVGLAEEGSGTAVIGVDWPSGDVPVGDCKTWVQRAGKKQEDIATLGWETALEMYRPLLSYDELSGILEGTPSAFYDQLYKLLGLEQLNGAITLLDVEVKQLRQPAADLRKTRDALKPILESHDDPRAATALAQLRKTKPDLNAVRPLITDGTDGAVPQAWLRAERLSAPDPDDLALKCEALRSAAESQQQEAQRSDALAAERAQLLERGLDFHEHFGDQKCPVCAHGTLDETWAVAARAALEQDQEAAQALTAARAATAQARSAVMTAVREVAAPPPPDPELTTLTAAREAYDAFVKLPADGEIALVEHISETLGTLRETYASLRQEAAQLIQLRADAWGPVALELAEWVRKAELAAEAAPKLKVADEALKWLQRNAGELRNQRIAPLAEEAKGIWAALRQESNVDLGEIRLEGQKTSRRVVLKADVDGSGTDAFGVMSQGELQALSLAIFIPRATSPSSPFRFLVLDDPIQAMDPSKIDGFLEVLVRLAETRQVIVFTHDDRLPSAIRVSRAPARIVELTRAPNSVVSVTESTHPADRLLDDAYAIAVDDAVPDDIKKKAVPVLCREAMEATAWDVYSSRLLTAGRTRADLEEAWENATTTRLRVALAVDPANDNAIEKWLAGGSARRAAMLVTTKGAHKGVQDYTEAVRQTRLATDDLRKLSP